MPLLLAVTLAAAVQPACSWDNPGHNPYTGTVAAAVDRYTDMPAAVRSTLKRRVEEGLSDDQVSITRDSIAGKHQYDAAIRDMHFGKSSVCATVTRNKWADTRTEPGAVYCVDQHCILVPRICGNISRVTRIAAATTATAARQAEAATAADAQGTPVEFANLHLDDAPGHDSLLDDPEEAAHKQANHVALDNISNILSEEELAEAADKSRYGAFGRTGLFGVGDEEFTGPMPSAVPEADTWAMLAAGLGLIGWQARRRARRQHRK